MPSPAPVIVWFREDLRLADNPALDAAARSGRPIAAIYIREAGEGSPRAMGAASEWWLDKSLRALSAALVDVGIRLILRSGQARIILPSLAEDTGAEAVFWNRRYGQPERDTDAEIKAELTNSGLECKSFNGRLLVEPWQLQTKDGGWYKVFTPYWRALQSAYKPPPRLPPPKALKGAQAESEHIDDWKLHPTKPDWSSGLAEVWEPGEQGAVDRLNEFLDGPIADYSANRNIPGETLGTSRLSPHLRFGEISPAQIWRSVAARLSADDHLEDGGRTFLSEIGWREFSYSLLYYNPDLAHENYNSKFNSLKWRKDARAFEAWIRGQTGYPIVDAGMRQLWQTGWMHNRVRMICASFLTKHLLLPWQDGEKWFWDTLVDADPAANPASWQWTAGTGADAAPYFRVFNPITQGRKFDEDGSYVRHWCPELSQLPDRHLHAPFEASHETLAGAGITLGKDYPEPIVEHSFARERALDAFNANKQEQSAE